MPTALHKKWHVLPAGPPGRRFRNRYYQHQKSLRGHGLGPMILRFVLALVAAVIGFILVFIPGPAIVFFLISGALLAADWLPVARLLDWSEVRARRLWKRGHAKWVTFSKPVQIALAVTCVVSGAAATYWFYRLMK
jgi:hypothetical protein